MRKLTNEEVDVRIKELIGDEYTRLGITKAITLRYWSDTMYVGMNI